MDRSRSYLELLRDPRWQRRRLEIMEREGFACERCKAADKTLNVHHDHYDARLLPWEYPSESLHCLCEDCHLGPRPSAELRFEKAERERTAAVEREFVASGLSWDDFLIQRLYQARLAAGILAVSVPARLEP